MKCDIRYAIYGIRARGCRRLTEAGVTLVEMLIVLAIITLLASLVIGMATHIDNQSKGKSLENTFAVLESALEEYREYTGGFPDGNHPDLNVNSETLYAALNSVPSSRKLLEQISDSLIKHKVDTGAIPPIPEIYDPWGKVLDYRYNFATPAYPEFTTYPELISAGPDRIFGSPDDISSKKK